MMNYVFNTPNGLQWGIKASDWDNFLDKEDVTKQVKACLIALPDDTQRQIHAGLIDPLKADLLRRNSVFADARDALENIEGIGGMVELKPDTAPAATSSFRLIALQESTFSIRHHTTRAPVICNDGDTLEVVIVDGKPEFIAYVADAKPVAKRYNFGDRIDPRQYLYWKYRMKLVVDCPNTDVCGFTAADHLKRLLNTSRDIARSARGNAHWKEQFELGDAVDHVEYPFTGKAQMVHAAYMMTLKWTTKRKLLADFRYRWAEIIRLID
ncbi:MAG: hypothetical protein J4F41_09495 [Alphaproteobacteria bacterium]|nr:hypothetical protein [Alphaproteobacteria bacterium]